MAMIPVPISGGAEVWKACCRVRERAPLIQCIIAPIIVLSSADTRFGDIIVAAGATPVVILGTEIIPKSMQGSKTYAVCIGAGNLSLDLVQYMKDAIRSARQFNKPCVLDLVGAEMTKDRTRSYLGLIDLVPSVIRGDESVIKALAPNQDEVGADPFKNAIIAARMLALASRSVVNLCGKYNLVTDGHRVIVIRNGMNLLDHTPEKCRAVSGMIAAFAAVDPSHILDSTACAVAAFGLALEIALDKASSSSSSGNSGAGLAADMGMDKSPSSSSGNSDASSYLEKELISCLSEINEQQCKKGVRVRELNMKRWKW